MGCRDELPTETVNDQKKIDSYLCRIPWGEKHSIDGPPCKNEAEFRTYADAMWKFKTTSEEEIFKMTGCLASCKRREHNLKERNEFTRDGTENEVNRIRALLNFFGVA